MKRTGQDCGKLREQRVNIQATKRTLLRHKIQLAANNQNDNHRQHRTLRRMKTSDHGPGKWLMSKHNQGHGQ